MARQVAVIGLGRFGSSVARTLYQAGHDVLAIDQDEKATKELVGHVTYPVQGDATSEDVLREVGISNFEVAVIAIGSDMESSLLSTVLIKSMGVRYVLARARNEVHASALRKVGADRVVQVEKETGVQIAHLVAYPEQIQESIQGYMELTSQHGVSKVHAPKRLHNLTLVEAGLAGSEDRNGLVALAILRGRDLVLTPDPEDRIHAGDVLVLAGSDELLAHLVAEGVVQTLQPRGERGR